MHNQWTTGVKLGEHTTQSIWACNLILIKILASTEYIQAKLDKNIFQIRERVISVVEFIF